MNVLNMRLYGNEWRHSQTHWILQNNLCHAFVLCLNTLFGLGTQPVGSLKMHHWSTVFHTTFPTQKGRREGVPQTCFQRGSFQQTSSSPSPGAELFLTEPPGTVGSTQKPSSPKPPAAGSCSESVQHSRIHGWGHPWDTPVSFSVVLNLPQTLIFL